MKLSVNTLLFGACPDRDRYTPVEAIKRIAKAGFDAVDFNFCPTIHDEAYLRMDNWKNTIEKVSQTANECGIVIEQSHLPFYNFATPGCEEMEFRGEMLSRSITASAILGVKWAVFHAGNAPDAVLSIKESKRRTLEFLDPYLNQAAALGVGIAIENLFIPAYLNSTHRYCSNVEDVCDLVDTIGEIAGICWDFGHANLIGDNQTDCLKAAGKRLKALHVHDNRGKHDDHAPPFTSGSNIKWADILPVLKEIGYSGNFNFEVGASRVPDSLHDGLASFLELTGRYMIKMIG
ncbi:MAG: sugar phosphate isomerase/epimerase family protein [Bacillota bacterium]|nr:sugar phosphate isomerase/epimerase family protein [Bacillota bacterium]